MNVSHPIGPVLASNEEFRDWLQKFRATRDLDCDLLPWVAQLTPPDLERLRNDLTTILSEADDHQEETDWNELGDILSEFADLAGWIGPLVHDPMPGPESDSFTIDTLPQQLRLIERSPAGVQRAVQELTAGFLTSTPTNSGLLAGYRVKKLAERDLYQIELPDAYRLRYIVDEEERIVYVVYLGPHPTGAVDGRERTVRAMINRRRNEKTSAASE